MTLAEIPSEIYGALIGVGVLAILAGGTAAVAWIKASQLKAEAIQARLQVDIANAKAEAAKASADVASAMANVANDRVGNVARAQDTIRSDLTSVAAQMTPTPKA